MEVAGLVAKIIRDEKPVKVNINVGGLGVGVADRLEEQGYGEIINRVNFGGKPIELPPFDETGKPAGGSAKRRAEMWLNMKTASIAGPALRSLTATACIPTSARSANHVLTPADVYFGRAEAILAGLRPRASSIASPAWRCHRRNSHSAPAGPKRAGSVTVGATLDAQLAGPPRGPLQRAIRKEPGSCR